MERDSKVPGVVHLTKVVELADDLPVSSLSAPGHTTALDVSARDGTVAADCTYRFTDERRELEAEG